jgi:hypothetical protein
MTRERDIRKAIEELLVATNAFSYVAADLPEDYGFGASQLTAAVVSPDRTAATTGWDSQLEGGLAYTAQVVVTILVRDEDKTVRDDLAERLLNVLQNAVNGQSLADMTMPGMTRVTGWRWLKVTPPERRIAAVVSFVYIVEGWGQRDTTS